MLNDELYVKTLKIWVGEENVRYFETEEEAQAAGYRKSKS